MTPLEELALWALDRACDTRRWNEDDWELIEEAVRLGLFPRVPYDPEVHGDVEDAEPGDEITVWADYEPLTGYRRRSPAPATQS
jgi:hypothetical protein